MPFIPELEFLAPVVVALVIVVMLAAFVTEWRPPEITAGIGVSILLVPGILAI